jgi:hypothetical protein
MDLISAQVLQQYRSLWGEPDRAATFTRANREVRVFKWTPEQTGEGVTLYTTVGISDQPIGPDAPSHRAEVILGLLPEDDRIARPLGILALSSTPDDPYLFHGHTVSMPTPFWPGCPFSAFLFLNPLEAIGPPINHDGIHVHFLQAIPVFPSEIAYKTAHTPEALMALWESVTLPFWSLRRRPLPKPGSAA